MPDSRNKRGISTCTPCYNRKQRCNRRFPCQHCTRRRQPEACVYSSTPGAYRKASTPEPEDYALQNSDPSSSRSPISRDAALLGPTSAVVENIMSLRGVSLVKTFGYSEDSGTNTMALLKAYGVRHTDGVDHNIIPCIMDSVQRDLERMPARAILDALLRYFVSELDWMKQLIHTSAFLARYQAWWHAPRPLSPPDIEFAVLFLRICAYTTRLVPAPFYTIDRKGAIQIPEVDSACGAVADGLSKACIALDWMGSVVRVQHLIFAAIKSCCDGRTDQYWEGIGRASQAAQKAGIYRESPDSRGNNRWDMEDEMRRKVLCNLYILDSHLSRQLDRVAFLPDCLIDERLPRMHVLPDVDHHDCGLSCPDSFTERLLQARLAKFWRTHAPNDDCEYDPAKAEKIYGEFCKEFLARLPPSFALKPDTTWDQQIPRLSRQRQVLHVYIYDSICWSFRRSILVPSEEIAAFPPYKRVLLRSQLKVLANAALRELDLVSNLDSQQSHFGAIIFNTFEATVLLLVFLRAHASLLGEEDHEISYVSGFDFVRMTPRRILQAAEKSMQRLQGLADTSNMAATGASIIGQLLQGVQQEEAPSSWKENTSWTPSFLDSVTQVAVSSEPPITSSLLGANDILQWFDMDSTIPEDWQDGVAGWHLSADS